MSGTEPPDIPQPADPSAEAGKPPDGPVTALAKPPADLAELESLLDRTDRTTDRLMRLLEGPPGRIPQALKSERDRLSAVLYHRLARRLVHLTDRWHRLLEACLDELQSRDPAELRTGEVVKIADLAARALGPIQKLVALAPPPDRLPAERGLSVTAETVNLLVAQAHARRRRSVPPIARTLPG